MATRQLGRLAPRLAAAAAAGAPPPAAALHTRPRLAAAPSSAMDAASADWLRGRGWAMPAGERGAGTIPTLTELGIELVVCDMAGTTVEEHGLVYKTLRQAMVSHGLSVGEDEMHPWHGAAKTAVVRHFIDRTSGTGVSAADIDATFERMVSEAYSQPGATSLIVPDLARWVDDLHLAGVKLGLNTGYPIDIQNGLLSSLDLDTLADSWVSAAQVAEGRPFPYMVHRLMEQTGVADVTKVAKFGDTVNDVLEGRNAGCGLVVGVLSGADNAEQLYAAGADLVVPNVTHLKAGPAVETTEASKPAPEQATVALSAPSAGGARKSQWTLAYLG